jgi:hypothetical protein
MIPGIPVTNVHGRVGRPDFRIEYTEYRVPLRARLWHWMRVRLPIVGALVLALATGGCSFSYQLGSLFGEDSKPPEATNSITPTSDPGKAMTELPPEGDLAYARAAASEVLSQSDKESSAHWENPSTGARGMVIPGANSHTEDGLQCRDFLASYVRQGSEAWLQGEACKARQGKWEVRSLKPWKRV